jgi:hypothetical protein
MFQTFPTHTAPQIINAPEERPITAWQEHYPDCWLLLEVTQEDAGSPLQTSPGRSV